MCVFRDKSFWILHCAVAYARNFLQHAFELISASLFFFLTSFIPKCIQTSYLMMLFPPCHWIKGEMKLCFRAIGVCFPLILQDFYVRNECFRGISSETTPVEFIFYSFPRTSREKCRLFNALEIYFYKIFASFSIQHSQFIVMTEGE